MYKQTLAGGNMTTWRSKFESTPLTIDTTRHDDCYWLATVKCRPHSDVPTRKTWHAKRLPAEAIQMLRNDVEFLAAYYSKDTPK